MKIDSTYQCGFDFQIIRHPLVNGEPTWQVQFRVVEEQFIGAGLEIPEIPGATPGVAIQGYYAKGRLLN